MTVFWILLLWTALATFAGILIGRGIRLADEQQDRARRRSPVPPPGPAPPSPTAARRTPGAASDSRAGRHR